MRAHPRSRGENQTDAPPRPRLGGSSPLTRGKHVAAAARPARTRLIPAHAGKTTPPPATPRARRAHPRSRGENKRPWRSWLRPAGSSPLTRGKHQIGILDSTDGRLIPAHAGKTRSRRRNAPGRPAHPRSRGENPFPSTKCAGSEGSSPLTRGKPQLAHGLD